MNPTKSKSTLAWVCGTAVALFVGAGCGSSDSTQGTPTIHEGSNVSTVDNTTRASGPGKILATITTTNNHTFVFGQSAHGDLVVAESAPMAEKQILDRNVTSNAITDVYRTLTNGLQPPESLVQAEAAAALHEESMSPVQPPVVAPKRTLRPDVNNDWFYQTFCTPNFVTVCDEASGTINASHGQWVYGKNFDAWGYNYPQNTQSAAMLEYLWTGYNWNFDWISGSINPGYYWYEYWFNASPVYRSTELTPQGMGGMAMGSPALVATWTTANSNFGINDGNGALKGQWPHDSQINCHVSDGVYNINVVTFSTNLTGINVAMAPSCPFLGEQDFNTETMCCHGVSTGTTACAVVSGDPVSQYFNPGYCCRSMGGNRQGC